MVNARRARDGNNVRITFEFNLEEVAEANMYNLFVEAWGAKRPSELIAFLYELTRRQRDQTQAQANAQARQHKEDLERILRGNLGGRFTSRQRTQEQYWNTFGGVYENFRRILNDDRPPRAADPAWCAVLGLPSTATPTQIKARYRELVKRHHPDAGGSAKQFHEIQEAYKMALQ